MSDLPDLFPGFASHWIDAPAGSIFARSGGSGPPLLLLHGFGETHVAFEKIAPRLAERFFVVAMDLRGYGWSSAPASEKGEAYTKRAQGEDVIVVMEQLGHVRFSLIGHDRGARVGFRLALDHPGRLEKLALLDIAPLEESLGDANLKRLGRARLLSQPAPKPEQLIGLDPKAFLADTLASGTKSGTLDAFDARAFAHYRAAFDEPSRIHAFCEDFRAGAGPDRELDLADRAAGEKIVVPTLALWGAASFSGHGAALLEQWREWADDLHGVEIDSGHYLAEEAPEATFAALDLFL
ncbi:alpha/beta hydrolase [Methylosinus sp. LW3]|uniref:alpha/beta fold hydrolase n=1 Tax=Methylosinus sp. LW3 TaxID=107635 RepID=UPI0004670879|nr:alpha/beta hydrolase [Methylosinus sp. LW3]